MTSQFSTLTPERLSEELMTCLQTNEPAMVWGKPGIGKSAIVAQTAKRWLGDEWNDNSFIDFRANLHDPVDLVGVPSVDNGITRWNSPAFLPRRGRGVFNIEELPNSHRAMQSALYPLIYHPRRIGDYRFPDEWRILLTGNRIEDRGGTFEMPTPLKSRMLHFELDYSVADWTKYAFANNIHQTVVAYVNWREEHLCDIDHAQWASPTPRTWEKLSSICHHLDTTGTEISIEIVQACIGPGVAHDYIAFIREAYELPTVEDMKKDSNCLVPLLNNLGMCNALISKIVHAMNEEKDIAALMPAVEMFQPELQVIWARGLDAKNKDFIFTEAYEKWMLRNQKYLM